jgi:hypothetical protein
VLVYTGILLAITWLCLSACSCAQPLKVDVIRDRGALARMVEQGRIENVYRLQIMNATELSGYRFLPDAAGPGSHPILFDIRSSGRPTRCRRRPPFWCHADRSPTHRLPGDPT